MRADHNFPHGQHGGPLLAEEGISYINIATIPPLKPPSHLPTVTPLFTPPQICGKGRQWHIWPHILLTRSSACHSDHSYGLFKSTGTSMEDVYPSKWARFCDSFRNKAHDIAEGLSASQASAANARWRKWAEFCWDMALDPLLVPYRDLVPILNTFVRQYRAGSLASIGYQVRSCTVEDAIRFIFRMLSYMGYPYPCLTSQGKQNIWLLVE